MRFHLHILIVIQLFDFLSGKKMSEDIIKELNHQIDIGHLKSTRIGLIQTIYLEAYKLCEKCGYNLIVEYGNDNEVHIVIPKNSLEPIDEIALSDEARNKSISGWKPYHEE
jgi:hypothetical protein